tara:strand:- start:194 stop:508 length:315 start_codon:yes stop_codon:yes gene_type:complete
MLNLSVNGGLSDTKKRLPALERLQRGFLISYEHSHQRDRKKALEGAIAGGWMNIYEIKESKFAKDEQIVPKPRYFKASENPMPPTLKELGLDKAMNGKNIGGIE